MENVHISRVDGLSLTGDPTDPAKQAIQVLVQAHTKPGPDRHMHLKLPLLDALYLLNLLEAMAAENHLDHLRQPPEGQH